MYDMGMAFAGVDKPRHAYAAAREDFVAAVQFLKTLNDRLHGPATTARTGYAAGCSGGVAANEAVPMPLTLLSVQLADAAEAVKSAVDAFKSQAPSGALLERLRDTHKQWEQIVAPTAAGLNDERMAGWLTGDRRLQQVRRLQNATQF